MRSHLGLRNHVLGATRPDPPSTRGREGASLGDYCCDAAFRQTSLTTNGLVQAAM